MKKLIFSLTAVTLVIANVSHADAANNAAVAITSFLSQMQANQKEKDDAIREADRRRAEMADQLEMYQKMYEYKLQANRQAFEENYDASDLVVKGGESYNSKNYVEAMKWYRHAAAKGNAEAQCNIGILYYQGQGVAKDYVEALKWFRKAAAKGIASAQYNIGVMYYQGQGVAKDYVESHKWLNLAAAQGQGTLSDMDELEQKMTPAQLAKAQKLATDWKPVKALDTANQQRQPQKIEYERQQVDDTDIRQFQSEQRNAQQLREQQEKQEKQAQEQQQQQQQELARQEENFRNEKASNQLKLERQQQEMALQRDQMQAQLQAHQKEIYAQEQKHKQEMEAQQKELEHQRFMNLMDSKGIGR